MLKLGSDHASLVDAASRPMSLCGKTFMADVSGALYWPAEKALIVADLHLEKASSVAHRGFHLPPYDTRETLMKLAEAIERFAPALVIALGDSLHDKGAADRIAPEDLAALKILQEDRRWLWITGNHDPEIAPQLGGEVSDVLALNGLTLRHAPHAARTTHEIAGHLHPCARVSMYGHTIRRPCFVGNGRRLILPAFGALTGGLNVLDEAFSPLFGDEGLHVTVLGQEGIYPIATRLLRPE
ncbi:MAG: ligase-associated DNA damage response endonuclease PdeM [Hyphomicrobiaceae bacterium]